MGIIDAFVPFVFFASVVAIVYLFLTTRNKERMSIIEKGYDPALLYKNKVNYMRILLYSGFIILGVGLGLIAGFTISNAFYNVFHHWENTSHSSVDGPNYSYLHSDAEIAYFASILFFVGIGLVSSYFIDRKINKQDEVEEN